MSYADTAWCAAETLAICVPTALEGVVGRVTMEKCDERLDGWAKKLVTRVEARVDLAGRDAVDWSRAYIIMSNHQSLFDIPVLYATVPGAMRMVAKKELFRIPLFGRALALAGFVKLDRSDRTAAMQSLRDAGDMIARGVHLWISPEGTRSPDGAILPLKKGGFILAKETGTPILPVTLDGTRDILPARAARIRRGVRVAVRFGTPLDPGRSVPELVKAVAAHFAGG